LGLVFVFVFFDVLFISVATK